MNPDQTPVNGDEELIEKLAAIEHKRWARWQQWVHKCLKPNPMGEGFPYLLDPEWVERWERQIATNYKDLTDQEKESDRAQVMRYWPLLLAWRDHTQAPVTDLAASGLDAATGPSSTHYHDENDSVVVMTTAPAPSSGEGELERILGLFEQHVRNHSHLNKKPELSLAEAAAAVDAYVAQQVEAAKLEVIEWLEADLKRLDSRNWTMEALALDTIVGSGKADDYQKSKRQQIVEDRRAAHALYAILANYKKLAAQQRKGEGQHE